MGSSKRQSSTKSVLTDRAIRHTFSVWNVGSNTPAGLETLEFDVKAWLAVVQEQKLAIARAAGVDPSKVRIRIGH